MVKKRKSLFECQSCGFTSAKWMGRCQNCQEWESFIELNEEQQEFLKNSQSIRSSTTSSIQSIVDIEEDSIERFSSGDSELDLVLGGGIVPGSLVLIGGSPGVGKSTLLLKIGANIAKTNTKVLYVSGEESLGQIKIRSNRLDANESNLFLLPEIELEKITASLYESSFEVLIIDSIQTLYSSKVSSAPGSVTQVRDITFKLMRLAKDKKIAVFIIGHITKDGSIAGPRVLEHMVDVVLYFEGDASKELRVLRGFKNRFGPTSEIGIFEMRDEGLISAANIASKFYNRSSAQPGSALTVIMEGSRPIVIEVQALVSDSTGATAKRQATGFDNNRLTMLLALLERKLEIPLNHSDVFVNIAGGIKINETTADLAILAAIISSYRNRSIKKDSLFIGEVSLIGDIREVFHLDTRLKEAESQGFSKAVLAKKPLKSTQIKCFEVDEVTKIIEWM